MKTKFIKTASIFSIMIGMWLSTPLLAKENMLTPEDSKLYRSAFNAAEDKHFDQAITTASKAHDKQLIKVLHWQRYLTPGSGASFAEITNFIETNPYWPNLSQMENRAEEAITINTPTAPILAWFDKNSPKTVSGIMAYGKALKIANRLDDARIIVKKFWINGDLTQQQEQEFLENFGTLLENSDHLARLDHLLWDHQEIAAKRNYPMVDADHQILADARTALYNRKSNAESLLSKVSAELQNNPGLIYEQIRYHRQNENFNAAIELLRQEPENPPRQELWWNERVQLARRALQQEQFTQAYQLVSQHHQTGAVQFAEAEWLSGWIALRFIDNKDEALKHFQSMFKRVSTPQSLARSAYWTGRTLEAQNNQEEALAWYKQSAVYVTTFYGQLAADHLDPINFQSLPQEPAISKEDTNLFEKNELIQIAHRLYQIHCDDMLRPFLLRFAETTHDPEQKTLAANLASSYGRNDVAVTIAKNSEKQGIPLINAGYPVIRIDETQPEKALILGIIRQESAFQLQVASPVGALGLMQLMPETAAKIAKELNIKLKKKEKLNTKLIQNPSLNVKLGAAYLDKMLQSFNGSYILAIASYNAGPGRIRHWIHDFGDPRSSNIDPIDWIERIPYSETRGYVQHVLEGVQIYRRRLDLKEKTQSLEKDLSR